MIKIHRLTETNTIVNMGINFIHQQFDNFLKSNAAIINQITIPKIHYTQDIYTMI